MLHVVESRVDVVHATERLFGLFEAARQFGRCLAERGGKEFAEVPCFAQGDAETVQ